MQNQTASKSNISTRTVSQELHKMDFHAQEFVHNPKIIICNAKYWLKWCKAHEVINNTLLSGGLRIMLKNQAGGGAIG